MKSDGRIKLQPFITIATNHNKTKDHQSRNKELYLALICFQRLSCFQLLVVLALACNIAIVVYQRQRSKKLRNYGRTNSHHFLCLAFICLYFTAVSQVVVCCGWRRNQIMLMPSLLLLGGATDRTPTPLRCAFSFLSPSLSRFLFFLSFSLSHSLFLLHWEMRKSMYTERA